MLIIKLEYKKKRGVKMNIQEILQTLNFSSVAWQILAPCIFSICDVITGFIQAVINKDVDSQIMRNGLLHKVLIVIIIFPNGCILSP